MTEACIPEFSGTAKVEAAAGGSPESPPPKPPAKPLSYVLEDISDVEDEPTDPFAMSFLERHSLRRAPPLRARTVANPAVRGRVTPLPLQGDVSRERSFLPPRCSAPEVRITDPYYWPNESDWEYTAPPAANLRYFTPVSALSTPVVMTTVSRPCVFIPLLAPLPGMPIVSWDGRGRSLWCPEGAPANAASMRGTPPMMEAEPVRKLRRPHGREQDFPTVSFTPTTDRPTDAFCACTAAVAWLSAIPHLISVTVGQPGSSFTRVSSSTVVPRRDVHETFLAETETLKSVSETRPRRDVLRPR